MTNSPPAKFRDRRDLPEDKERQVNQVLKATKLDPPEDFDRRKFWEDIDDAVKTFRVLERMSDLQSERGTLVRLREIRDMARKLSGAFNDDIGSEASKYLSSKWPATFRALCSEAEAQISAFKSKHTLSGSDAVPENTIWREYLGNDWVRPIYDLVGDHLAEIFAKHFDRKAGKAAAGPYVKFVRAVFDCWSIRHDGKEYSASSIERLIGLYRQQSR